MQTKKLNSAYLHLQKKKRKKRKNTDRHSTLNKSNGPQAYTRKRKQQLRASSRFKSQREITCKTK